MLTSVNGVYENGRITLDEIPEIKNKSKIVVTFRDEVLPDSANKRRLGGSKGKVGTPDDFNSPLSDLNDYMFISTGQKFAHYSALIPVLIN